MSENQNTVENEEYTELSIRTKKIVADDFTEICNKLNKSQEEILETLISLFKDSNVNKSTDVNKSTEFTQQKLFIKNGADVNKCKNIIFKGKKIFESSPTICTVLPTHYISQYLRKKPNENKVSIKVYLTENGRYIIFRCWETVLEKGLSVSDYFKSETKQDVIEKLKNHTKLDELDKLLELLVEDEILEDV